MRTLLIITLFCLTTASSPWDGFNEFMNGVDIEIPRLELNLKKKTIELTKLSISKISSQGIAISHTKTKGGIGVTVTIDNTAVTVDTTVTITKKKKHELESKPTSGVIKIDALIEKLTIDLTLDTDSSSVPTSISDISVKGTNKIKTKCSCPCSDTIIWYTECDVISGVLSGSGSVATLLSTVLSLKKKEISSILTNIATVMESFNRTVPKPPSSEGWEPQYDGYLNLNSSVTKNIGMILNKVYGVNGTGLNSDRLVINQVIDKMISKLQLPQLVFDKLISTDYLPIDGINIRVKGLDTISVFNPLVIAGNHTVHTELEIHNVTLEVSLPLTLLNKTTPPHKIEVTAELRGVDLSVDLLLALGINATLANSLEIGSFFESWGNLIQCAGYPVGNVEVKYLNAAIKKISNISVSSEVLSPKNIPTTGGVNSLVADIFSLVSAMYGSELAVVFPYALYAFGPLEINKILKETIVKTNSCPSPKTHDGIVNFTNSDLISIIDFVAHDVLGDIPSDMSFNKVIHVLLTDANTIVLGNGSVIVNAPIVSTPQNMDIGYFQLTTKNGFIKGLESFSDVKILQSSSDNNYKLSTELVMSNLNISSDISLLWDEMGPHVADIFHLALDMENVTLKLDFVVHFEKKTFDLLHTNQLSEPCLFSAMSPQAGLRVPVSKLTTEKAHMAASCYSCTSGTIDAWGAKLKKPEAHVAIANTLNNITTYLLQTYQTDKANTQLDLRQHNGAQQCISETPSPSPEVESETTFGSTLLLLEVVGIPALLCVVVLIFSAKRANDALEAAKNLDNEPLLNEQHNDDEDDAESVVSTSPSAYETTWYRTLRFDESISGHAVTPKYMKTLVPIALVGLFVLLLTSMLYYKAIVIANVTWIAGQGKIISAYDYTTFKFTRDGFNHGGVIRLLAIGFGLLAGSLSYIKLLAMFYLFYVPPTILSHKSRTTCIEWIDYGAKWSLLDMFVILFLCTVVDCNLALPPDWVAWEDRLIEADLIVSTWFGMHGFVLAQVGGMTIGQLLVIKNRDVIASMRATFNATMTAKKNGMSSAGSAISGYSRASVATTTWFQDGAEDLRREALRVHHYPTRNTILGKIFLSPDTPVTVPGKNKEPTKQRSHINILGRVLVVFALVLCITLVIIGLNIPFIGVHNTGFLIPVLNTSPGEGYKRSWSFTGFAKQFLNVVGDSSTQKVIHYILFCFGIIVVIIVPLLQFILLVVVWVMPLTLKEHKKLFFITECLASWSALEVFIVALGVITLMMHDLMSFVIGNKFDGVTPILHSLVNWGTSDLEPLAAGAEGDWCLGFVFLATGCVLFHIAYFMLHRANKAAIRDRERTAALNLETHSKRTYDDSLCDSDSQCVSDVDIDIKNLTTPPAEDIQVTE